MKGGNGPERVKWSGTTSSISLLPHRRRGAKRLNFLIFLSGWREIQKEKDVGGTLPSVRPLTRYENE